MIEISNKDLFIAKAIEILALFNNVKKQFVIDNTLFKKTKAFKGERFNRKYLVEKA